MSKPFYVSLPGRGRLRLDGPDAVAFLNALVSNDVSRTADGSAVYACLLTPQGKFLHDMIVMRDGDALLLDCEGGDRAQDLHDRLLKFRLRAKVSLALELSTPVYVRFDDGGEGVADPRHAGLGRRTYMKPDLGEEPFETYDRLRISLGVPDGSRDMEVEKSTLLECRVDRLNGIDWNKGCYMGQELTARMHYRGLAKKHLFVVETDTDAPPAFTDLPNGGQMRSSCDGIGLALLKDDALHMTEYAPLKPLERQPWA